MSETKNPGEKKLSVSGSKLTLKPRSGGGETGVVRQSFSHGRSKQVVVEKVKRRALGGPGDAPPAPAPVEAPKKPAAPAPKAAAPAPRAHAEPPKSSGVVLRTLTEEERAARAHALADSRVREAEERKIAEEEARRKASREVVDQTERNAAEARKREEDERRKHDEETKKKADEVAKKRFGEEEAKRTTAPAARSRRRRTAAHRAPWRPRPSGGCTEGRSAAWRREAARPSDRDQRAQCRRGARTFGRLVPPPHPTAQGPCRQRAEGKAGA